MVWGRALCHMDKLIILCAFICITSNAAQRIYSLGCFYRVQIALHIIIIPRLVVVYKKLEARY
jgi:hypothetical protein